MKAVDGFDADRGTAFSSYAVPSIAGAIKRHFRDHGWSVRVPRELQERAMRVHQLENELSGALGEAPTVAELADAPTLDADGDDDGYRTVLDHATLDSLLAGLDDRDRAIVELYFRKELTQSEIGERLGYSQMHISRLLRKAVGELERAAA